MGSVFFLSFFLSFVFFLSSFLSFFCFVFFKGVELFEIAQYGLNADWLEHP